MIKLNGSVCFWVLKYFQSVNIYQKSLKRHGTQLLELLWREAHFTLIDVNFFPLKA